MATIGYNVITSKGSKEVTVTFLKYKNVVTLEGNNESHLNNFSSPFSEESKKRLVKTVERMRLEKRISIDRFLSEVNYVESTWRQWERGYKKPGEDSVLTLHKWLKKEGGIWWDGDTLETIIKSIFEEEVMDITFESLNIPFPPKYLQGKEEGFLQQTLLQIKEEVFQGYKEYAEATAMVDENKVEDFVEKALEEIRSHKKFNLHFLNRDKPNPWPENVLVKTSTKSGLVDVVEPWATNRGEDFFIGQLSLTVFPANVALEEAVKNLISDRIYQSYHWSQGELTCLEVGGAKFDGEVASKLTVGDIIEVMGNITPFSSESLMETFARPRQERPTPTHTPGESGRVMIITPEEEEKVAEAILNGIKREDSQSVDEVENPFFKKSNFLELQRGGKLVDLNVLKPRKYLIRSVIEIIKGESDWAPSVESGQLMFSVGPGQDMFICVAGEVYKLLNPNKELKGVSSRHPCYVPPEKPGPGDFVTWDGTQAWFDNYLNGWLDAVVEN